MLFKYALKMSETIRATDAPPTITSPLSPVPLCAAAEGGGSGPSQEGVHLGLGFNEGGGECLQSDGYGGLGK